MTHFAFAVDKTTNDWFLADDGNVAVVQGAKAVAEHVRQRLRFFKGEWFLDTTAGMPWLDDIMARKFDPALAEVVVKREVLDTDYVTEITAFSVNFNMHTRDLQIRSLEIGTRYEVEVAV